MKKCNRCKVNKSFDDFKTEKSKTCISCREVSKNAYTLKKQGKLPNYAEINKLLEEAYERGNFVCKICKEEKLIKNFGKHKNNNKYNLSRVCKDCSVQLNKISKISSYGITNKEFLEKLEEQKYKCKICNSDIKYSSKYDNKYSSACIDHNHSTGEVRGLLCSSCNRGLGLFKDSIDIIEKAYQYLVQYKSDKLLENPEMDNQQLITNLNG